MPNDAIAKRKAAERSRNWRLANPGRTKDLAARSQEQRKSRWEEFLAQERARYKTNSTGKLAKQKLDRAAAPEKFRERMRNHYRANKASYVARVAKRRSLKLQATPTWVDQAQIEIFYRRARELTIATGIPHEVDHIYPLKGRNSCGLHVPWNLQVIPRSINRAKHNTVPRSISDTARGLNSRHTINDPSAGLAL